MTADLVERARRYLAKIPPAVSGAGGHTTAFRAALALRSFDLNPDDAFDLFAEWNRGCRPPWSPRELKHKLDDAWRTGQPDPRLAGGNPKSGHRSFVRFRPLPPAEFSPEHFAKVTSPSPALSWSEWRHWLWQRSPVIPMGVTSGGFLRHVFQPGERVAVMVNTTEKRPHLVEIRETGTNDLLNLRRGHEHGVWYLIQPVDGKWHDDGSGGKSCRNAAAVTSWRHMLLESDSLSPVDALRLLAVLPMRVVAIYTSGGRSIHSLVRVDADSKAHWDAEVVPLKRPLTKLGIDPGALTAVRNSRLPGCWREEKAQPQKLLFLNPNPTEGRLIDLPVVRSREVIR